MDNDTLWQRLIINTCLWFKKDCELLKTFKELQEAGAKLTMKTAIQKHTKRPIQKLYLRRGKIPEEDWNLIRTLKLEPYAEEITLLFEITAFGTVCDIQLAKPISEEVLAKTILRYFRKIVEAKEKQEEFTMQVGGKMLTVVPRRTDQDRNEITIEELYVLKYLQDEGVIKSPEEAREWVRWKLD